jgi:hypothetical protein
MIEIKKEIKKEKKRNSEIVSIKHLIVTIFIITLFSFSTQSVAETRDCSQYNTNTFFGTLDKRRCEKGLPPKERRSIGERLKKLIPFKKNK